MEPKPGSETRYGGFTLATNAVILPAGRIRGARLIRDEAGKATQVDVQLLSKERIAHIELPFLDAMYLLSLLRAMQLDSGFAFPDDPRMSDTSH